MAEYSEGVRKVAEALMPEPPGSREKREIYEQAGRAIVNLSNVEQLLAVVFCVISLPVEVNASKEMFASQGPFEKKLKLVNFIILHENNQEEKTAWLKIFSELNTHRGVRNLIAHQRMFVESPINSPEIEVSLAPLFYKKRGKNLRLSDIKSTADALAQIHDDLWAFIKQLDKPK